MRTNHMILGRTLKAGFFTSLALAIGGGLAIGAGVQSVLRPKQKSQAAPAATPIKTPDASTLQQKAADTASETALKKRRARTTTVLTGPRGLLTEPKTEQKGLAGTLG